MKSKNLSEVSPVEVFFNILGGKYKAAILWDLYREGPLRYNELLKLLPPLNPKTMTHQLREMEKDGVVKRTIYPEVPPKVVYEITDLGRSMYSVVHQAHLWGVKYVKSLSREDVPFTRLTRKYYLEEDESNNN